MCASDFVCILNSFLTIVVYFNTKHLQCTDSKSCSPPGTGMSVGAYIAVGVGAPCLIIFILGFLWFCGCLPSFCQRRKGDHCFLTLFFSAFDMELIIHTRLFLMKSEPKNPLPNLHLSHQVMFI